VTKKHSTSIPHPLPPRKGKWRTCHKRNIWGAVEACTCAAQPVVAIYDPLCHELAFGHPCTRTTSLSHFEFGLPLQMKLVPVLLLAFSWALNAQAKAVFAHFMVSSPSCLRTSMCMGGRADSRTKDREYGEIHKFRLEPGYHSSQRVPHRCVCSQYRSWRGHKHQVYRGRF
jgi:hypothetical protein